MKYEKEMIPIITDYLNNEMGCSIIINEFDSGYGIADIVATIDIGDQNYFPFRNIMDVFLLFRIPSNSWIRFDDITKITAYSEKYLKYEILKCFIEHGFVTRDQNKYIRTIPVKLFKNPIIAIEAKLLKWKDGLIQAMRYKKYADYCYVALLQEAIKNVDINMFKNNNVGLLAVSSDGYTCTISKAKKNKEKNKFYTLYANGVLYNLKYI